MKIITFLQEKGGVGKTTLSTHLAAGLAIAGRRVVLVDADPQGHSTVAVGLEKRNHFHDLTARNAPWKDVLQLVHPDVYSPVNRQATGMLYCVAGSGETFTTAVHLPRQSIIRERFERLQSVDYIIVDTSPTPSALHEAIAAATDYILVPTECEYFSAFEGTPDSLLHTGYVREAGAAHGYDKARVVGILPNKYDAKSATHRDTLIQLEKQYGELLWQSLPASKVVVQAQMRGQFLYALFPKHAITRAIWQVIERLEAVCQNA